MKIVAENLEKKYKSRPVVQGVSFEVSTGEVVGLLGPNGAGKTTTFYMVIGLVRPNGGRVLVDGKDITHWPMYKRARLGLSYLPQESSVFRRISVRDNIKLVMEMAGAGAKRIKERTEELGHELGITHIMDRMGGVLSGGERRRVEIARSLANEPKFILLDEPFTGIDPVTIDELQLIIGQLREKGIGVLITDHNVMATLRITDMNNILIDGQIRKRGVAAEIIADEHVREHYLGQSFDSPPENGSSGKG